PVCSTLMVFPALAMTPLPSLLCDLLGVALAATGLQRGHLDVAARGNRARRILVLERVEGRAHHVVRVRRAERLGDDVLHAERLEHRAHRAAGDDAGSGRRCAQEHLAGAVAAVHVVVQRAAFAQRHAGEPALGGIGCLADCFRHLAGLAVAEADAALLVADDDERGEAEAPAALYHLGHTVDMDELVDEFAVALFRFTAFTFTCHDFIRPARATARMIPRSSARLRARRRRAP